MRKLLGIAVLVLGVGSSFLFFNAAGQFGKTGMELTNLRSVGGSSVAEAYYQEVGRYGMAYSKMAYAMGLGTLMLSVGIGGALISKDGEITSSTENVVPGS